MHLQATIVVGQTNDQVWCFFNDLSNLARWDRSVAEVLWTSPEPYGVGSTFETIAPVRKPRSPKEGLRMSYRITSYVPNHMYSCLLTNSSMFTFAKWTMSTEQSAAGVRITCQFDGTLRFHYSFLLPILLLIYKGAFHRDLASLKQAIERDALAHHRAIAGDESGSSLL
jgi:Polyketide cyclase / dehydrase and lipid transport